MRRSWKRNNYTNFGNQLLAFKIILQNELLHGIIIKISKINNQSNFPIENFVKRNSFSFSYKSLRIFSPKQFVSLLARSVRVTKRANYSSNEKERERES